MMTNSHALRVRYSSFYIFLRSRHDNGPCTLCACVIHHITPFWRNPPATGRYKRDDKFSFFFCNLQTAVIAENLKWRENTQS